MLRLFNSFGKKMEPFSPVRKGIATIFTCGPSVYQRSHIGNFRTFLFEDVLVRYLEYSGYKVKRGMNFTDVEDKAIEEASSKKMSLTRLTDKNIREFMKEMKILRIKIPDYLPRASQYVDEAARIIEVLADCGIAYRYRGDFFFDPLKVAGFGELYGLDMSKWPNRKARFRKDTYPGNRWNLGDFILWHGNKNGDKNTWDTAIGRGRPSWNIQDAAMVSAYFNETLSCYCGGVDNLFRHHDYSKAILESIRPYPMARYWIHCAHLYVDGQKMSKSKGNILYTDTVTKKGYGPDELRLFLICGHYREVLDYSEEGIRCCAERLGKFKRTVRTICAKAQGGPAKNGAIARKIREVFTREMDNDLNVMRAFEGLAAVLSSSDLKLMKSGEARGVIRELKGIDEVLRVIF